MENFYCFDENMLLENSPKLSRKQSKLSFQKLREISGKNFAGKLPPRVPFSQKQTSVLPEQSSEKFTDSEDGEISRFFFLFSSEKEEEKKENRPGEDVNPADKRGEVEDEVTVKRKGIWHNGYNYKF